MANEPDETTSLTEQARRWRGSTHIRRREAAGPLFDRIYGDLVKIATTVNFSKNIDARDLVHQLYLRWDSNAALRDWKDRVEFFKTAKTALRNLVIDRYRESHPLWNALPVDDQLATQPAECEYVKFDDAVEEIGEEHGPHFSEILTMKYLSCDTDDQIAKALGVSESTAKRLFVKADAELRKRLGLPAKVRKQQRTPVPEA